MHTYTAEYYRINFSNQEMELKDLNDILSSYTEIVQILEHQGTKYTEVRIIGKKSSEN